MFWHPMLLAVMASDLMAMMLMLSASKTAFRVLLHWNPLSADKNQLQLEIAVEGSSIKSGAAAWALLISTIVLLVAVANVLPEIVPGAMCGTGVMQATDGMGNRALMFRFAAVLLLFWRNGLEKIAAAVPGTYLVQFMASLLLIALPLMFLATMKTFQSISGLEIQKPVDCCVALYDSVRLSKNLSLLAYVPETVWIVLFAAGTAFLLFWALRLITAPRLRGSFESFLGLLTGMGWVMVASITLIRILSAYHYQVLYHHCPWCFFLAGHWLVGYPLFGSLSVILFEIVMVFAAIRIGYKFPELQETVLARTRKSGVRLLAAVGLFTIISGLPAVLWRIEYGVWISG